MWSLTVIKYFCVDNIQAHPLGAHWEQRGGQALQASFRWFHYVYATEISRDFWPRRSGAKHLFWIPWLQHAFQGEGVRCREPPPAAPGKPRAPASLPSCTMSGCPQSCAPHRAPSSGVTSFQETSLQRFPFPKGVVNEMVPETEVIGNSVSVPDLSREAIPTPNNTSVPLCFHNFFLLLIIGPCEARGNNQKAEGKRQGQLLN